MKILKFFNLTFITIMLLFSPLTILAEEAEWIISSYITKFEYLSVPDTEKHMVGMYERRGVTNFKSGETAAYHTRGTYDFTMGKGLFSGYTDMTYNDGSMVVVKETGELTQGQGKLPTLKGKGEYIKGTGKFEGITGSVSFEGKYITPYNKETKGDQILNAKGTFTLPK